MRKILLKFSLFLIITQLLLSCGEEEFNRSDAYAWERKAELQSDPHKKFECLKNALIIYAILQPNVTTADFDWKTIIENLIVLHKKDSSLQMSQNDIIEFSGEGSVESLKLIHSCIDENLISFSRKDDAALLGALLRALAKESVQQSDTEEYCTYRDLAINIILLGIRKGASSDAFSSAQDPMSEIEIIRSICQVDSYKLYKAMRSNNLIPQRYENSPILKSWIKLKEENHCHPIEDGDRIKKGGV